MDPLAEREKKAERPTWFRSWFDGLHPGELLTGITVFALIFLISLGPKFNPGGLPGDLRFQDFTVLPIIIFWWLARDAPRLLRSGLSAFPRQSIFVGLQSITILVGLIWLCIAVLNGALSDNFTIRIGFILRYIEIPLLAGLAGRLVLRGGNFVAKFAVLGLALGASLNLPWVIIQAALIGRQPPPLNFSSTDPSMYGPGLLGEGAVLSTGHYLMILLSAALSVMVTTPDRRFLYFGALTAVIIFCLQLSVDSRASIVASSVAILLALSFLFLARIDLESWQKALLVGFSLIGAVYLITNFIERLSMQLVYAAFRTRTAERYVPALEAVSNEFFLGLGPGGSRIAIDGETHNTYVLFLVDHGVVGLFLALSALVFLIWLNFRMAVYGEDTLSKFYGFFSGTALMFVPIAGLVQDSILPVNSNHLTAIIVGVSLGLWRAQRLKEDSPGIEPSSKKSRV